MYSFAEIEKAVVFAGFELRNSTGSHHIYLHKRSGLTVTVPKHPAGVSIGVAESVLRTCALVARINNKNIGSDRSRLSKEVIEYIVSFQQKCKKNILFIIPEEFREIYNIKSKEDVLNYLHQFKKNFDIYSKPKQERILACG